MAAAVAEAAARLASSINEDDVATISLPAQDRKVQGIGAVSDGTLAG